MTFERAPTHIKGFDEATEGGFKKHSVNIVAGGAGSGKSTFAMQFLVNGALNEDEPALYMTFEQGREELIDDCSRFGWDLRKLEEENKLVILEYFPEQVKKLLAEGGGVLYDLIKRNDVKRLVIDSINSFTLMYEHSFDKRKAALKLFQLLRGWGCTTILTSEDEAPLEDTNISSDLEFESDSLIFFYHAKKDGERVRAVEIAKMRGTKHFEYIMNLHINTEGIAIHNKEKVIF